MNKVKNNKLLLVLGLILTILIISGGTFAYFQWQSSLEDKTDVIVSVTDDIEMIISPAAVTKTGMRPTNNCGGDFGMQGTSLVTIDNQTGVLARPRFKLKIKITDSSGNNITNESSPMGNPYRQYIKYAVAETNGACTSPLSSGRFNLNTETSTGSGWYDSPELTLDDVDGFPAVSDGANTGVSFNAPGDIVTTHTYKVWIWIDEEYTAISTGNTVNVDKLQDATITVSWSENSTVEQVRGDGTEGSDTTQLTGEAYAVYSADDTSLRFYRSETPITVGSTYNGRTATAVYTGFEEESYESAPWYDHYETITDVVFEDEVMPTSTANWFSGFDNCSNFDLTKLNTSYVTDMTGMFFWTASTVTTLSIVGLEGWNTSNVTSMYAMFSAMASNTTNLSLDLSSWNMSSVTNVDEMFYGMGLESSTIELDLSGWNFASLTTTNSGNLGMFGQLGLDATTSISIDVSGWNTSNITNMSSMFYAVGNNKVSSSIEIIGLNTWDVSKVTDMSYMFANIGLSVSVFSIDISGWNTSSVTDMSYMFRYTGSIRANYTLDLSDWNVCNVTSYDDFNLYVTDKITAPNWGMSCPTT